MINKNHKSFLYLVQARAVLAKKHLELESHRADVLIYTFDEEIKGKQFLYKANTIWAEGRNILIEHAKKLPTQYDYYVLMDDDIEFVRGSFKDFENEVLKIKPDMCNCIYPIEWLPNVHEKKTASFKYIAPIFADCLFVCLSRQLFYDKRLLPYHTAYLKLPIFGRRSIYYSYLFWINLFEYFGDKKLVTLNQISIENSLHHGTSTYSNICIGFFRLLKLLKKNDKNFSNKIKKALPVYYSSYQRSYDALKYRKYTTVLTQHYNISKKPYRLIGIAGSAVIRICWFFIKNQFTTNRPPKQIEGNIAGKIESAEMAIKGKMENRAAKLKHFRLYLTLLIRKVMSIIVDNKLAFYLFHLWQDIKLNIKIYLR